MTLPSSLLAYKDCIEVFDQALASTKGIRVPMPDPSTAKRFQARMQYCRVLDRAKNKELYDEGSAMYGASVYDELLVRVVRAGGKHYVYVEQVDVPAGIESLENVTEEPEPEAPPMALVVEAIKRRG